MNLEILNRPLTRDQIDFKISILTKGKDTIWASILAYKDARVDMQVLDEACGQLGWMNSYQRDSKGILQCTISIYDPLKKMDTGEWVSKTSNGTESDYESEKGEYSDAFKRAGFMWGIGRQLYDFPPIWVQLIEGDYYFEGDKARATRKLKVNEWNWEISEDYKSVRAERRVNGTFVEVYNSNPYKKKTK